MQKEINNLIATEPNAAQENLVAILQDKDEEILKLQVDMKKDQREKELLREQIKTYIETISVKDQSIIKLTNDLHECKLEQKMEKSPTRNFYVEKISVGSQTDIEKSKGKLHDTVTAFLKQNKLLNIEDKGNKQNKQQTEMGEREKKLLVEAGEWEAKFYQIQSKYLLLLNELHNPQVMISTSRQEMVETLLKDIVEKSEKPALTSENPEYDRFGFTLDKNGILKEKAERLQRVAQENLEEAELSKTKIERGWRDIALALGRPGHFTMTKEIKYLVRKGIPVNLRGSVWRALVMHRTRGDQGYYQALLANYNPGLSLSTAAKQIELDLLRTLPNNVYYDRPHARGRKIKNKTSWGLAGPSSAQLKLAPLQLDSAQPRLAISRLILSSWSWSCKLG